MKTSIGSAARPNYICTRCIRSLKSRKNGFATITNAKPDVYDVVCVGGGPAGLSLLTALRSSKKTLHLRLALIESQSLASTRSWSLPPTQFSNRASSLTPTSRSFLERIGAWDHIDHDRIQPYHHMHVWDGLATGSKIDFSTPPPSSDPQTPIAYMTENQNLTQALLARLDSLEPIESFQQTPIASIDLGPPPDRQGSLDLSSYPHISLSSTRPPLAARLLIGADGINSPVRNFAHIPTRGWDYDRHGLVATVRLAPQEDNSSSAPNSKVRPYATAYQRFLPTGPIALLALPGDHATLVWSTTAERAAHLKSLAPEDFAAMVNSAFRLSVVDIDYMFTQSAAQASEYEWRTGVTRTATEDETRYPRSVVSVQDGSVASFPLRYRHADRYVSQRIALVGDAAHTIHPLAGQGLNMGLGDVEALVKAIEYTVAHGGDIGIEGNLEAYESGMWNKNNRMLGVVDKLHKLYGVSWAPVVGVRGVGLGMVDRFEGLKGWIMGQAGGAG